MVHRSSPTFRNTTYCFMFFVFLCPRSFVCAWVVLIINLEKGKKSAGNNKLDPRVYAAFPSREEIHYVTMSYHLPVCNKQQCDIPLVRLRVDLASLYLENAKHLKQAKHERQEEQATQQSVFQERKWTDIHGALYVSIHQVSLHLRNEMASDDEDLPGLFTTLLFHLIAGIDLFY